MDTLEERVHIIKDVSEIYYIDTDRSKQIWLRIDSWAPKTVSGLITYKIGRFEKRKKTIDVFSLGDSSCKSLGMVRFPIYVKNYKGELIEKFIKCHLIERDLVMIIGNNIINRDWKMVLNSLENRCRTRLGNEDNK